MNYYTPLKEEHFKEIKKESINIWSTYDDEFGYAKGKINQIKNLENIADNGLSMIAMFDHINQKKLAKRLTEEARKEVALRIEAGGSPDCFNYFKTN